MKYSGETSVQNILIFVYKAVTLVALGSFLFFFAVLCAAMECQDILPADARMLGDLKLCEYQYRGKHETFACQDVAVKNQQYRVLFKGGRIPRAIIAKGLQADQDLVVWPVKNSRHAHVCSFPVPEQLPASAKFKGMGICKNDKNESIPCGIFRDKKSRRQKIPDYLVLYDVAGNGPEEVSVIHNGINRDAVPAELAYQIGLQLLKSTCCQQSGFAYLKYAYLLFPDSTLYREAYLQGIARTAGGNDLSYASSAPE
jgi:hypothetical protein